MSLSQDYAAKIRRAADDLEGLRIDRHDPAHFFERKYETVADLRKLADAVETDQVFVGRQSIPAEPSSFRRGPRHVIDRKGRPVAVEVRKRFSKGVPGRN